MAEENEEIEVIDVSLNEGEIDGIISHLVELKEHKKNVQFPLASDLDLSVTFSEEEFVDEFKLNEKSESVVDNKPHESDKQMKEVSK